MVDVAKEEHDLLVDILHVCLNESAATSNVADTIVYLDDLRQELADEGSALQLSKDNIDRALMTRLMSPPSGCSQEPFPYILGCYHRAQDTARRSNAGASTPDHAQHFAEVLQAVQQQLANHAWLCLSPDIGIVQQPRALEQRGPLQLYDAIWAAVQSEPVPVYERASTHCQPIPHGFLHRLTVTFPDEITDKLTPVLRVLAAKCMTMSVLGDFTEMFQCWSYLLESKESTAAVVRSDAFLPKAQGNKSLNGRQFQTMSALGALMGISYLMDEGAMVEPRPSVREQCLQHLDASQPLAIRNTFSTLSAANKGFIGSLSQMFSPKSLLSKDTRPITLRWLGAALLSNAERLKMQMQPMAASSDGFMYNLCQVLLNLCAPFADFNSGKAQQFINLEYLAGGGLLSFDDDARLVFDGSEYTEWQSSVGAGGEAAGPSGRSFHFITDCFFLTAHAMHIGVVKMLESLQSVARMHHELQAMASRSPGDQRLALEEKRIKAKLFGLECALVDTNVVDTTIQWCKLVASWLLFSATGQHPSQVELPLDASAVPPAFKAIPEYIVTDMCEILCHLSNSGLASTVVGAQRLDEVMLCCTALMASPAHVKNPYVRYCLGRVLFSWMPSDSSSRRSRRGMTSMQSANMEYLFTAHPGVSKQMIPALLNLYKDVEYTERGGQFYEKFSYRREIADLLSWLWKVPQHQAAWKAIAAENQGRGLYMSFLNYLINDMIYLLDEAIKKLPELKEKEALKERPQWSTLSHREQAEHMRNLGQLGNELSFFLSAASVFIDMLVYTTAEIAAPLLLPEMAARVAEALNYFLRYLTGPDRSKLKISNPDKYHFKPKNILSDILLVYVHLSSADHEGRFVTAISEDGMSYRPENFREALRIASEVGLPNFDAAAIAKLQALAQQVAQVVEQQQEDEEMLDDVPDEFCDPITCMVMKDPVVSPASGQVFDRGTIMRHLLSDPRDPINRAPLSADDLYEDTKLRERIQQWKQEQRKRP